MHSREEAQRMLSVFLSSERKSLLEITKIRMLPCRAWEHVLHMLGVDNAAQLHKTDRRPAAHDPGDHHSGEGVSADVRQTGVPRTCLWTGRKGGIDDGYACPGDAT